MRKMLGISALAVLLAVSGTAMADFATLPSMGTGSGASYDNAGTDFTVVGRAINTLTTDAATYGAPVSYITLNSGTAPTVGYVQAPNMGGSNVMRGLIVSKATAGAGSYEMKAYSPLSTQIFGYQDPNNFYFLVSRGYSVTNPTNENFGDTAANNPYQYDATLNPTGTWQAVTGTNPATWYLGVRVNGATHLIKALYDGFATKPTNATGYVTDAVINWDPATSTIVISAESKQYTAGAVVGTYTLASTTIVDSINGSHFAAGGAFGASSFGNATDTTAVRLANLAFTAAPQIPEPATLSLLVLGGLGVLARRRRA